MKKLALFLCVIAIVLPFSSQAFDLNRYLQAATKFKNVNITGYLFNSKAALKISDKLKVTQKAIFSKAVDIKGKLTG